MNKPLGALKYANRINWEEMRDLLRVLTHRSFAGAARDKGVTPPAIHKSIGALERRLGIKLVDRSVRPVKLTGEGHRLCVAAERFDDVLTDILNADPVSGGSGPEKKALVAERLAALAGEMSMLAEELRR
jgi:DNA-binding transcriptional LysR family regulator